MDYYFNVKNNLVQEAKHRQQMGDMIWLYLYILSYANGQNGKMILYIENVNKQLGLDKEMALTYLKGLEKLRYIVVEYVDGKAYLVTVNKWIKLR